jgi:hypothetical protein
MLICEQRGHQRWVIDVWVSLMFRPLSGQKVGCGPRDCGPFLTEPERQIGSEEIWGK